MNKNLTASRVSEFVSIALDRVELPAAAGCLRQMSANQWIFLADDREMKLYGHSGSRNDGRLTFGGLLLIDALLDSYIIDLLDANLSCQLFNARLEAYQCFYWLYSFFTGV